MADTTPNRTFGERLAAWVGPWQPFTGGGLAAFAGAGWVRVAGLQLGFAAAGAAVLLLALRLAWLPAVEEALGSLPESGAVIRLGRLQWPGTNSVLLGGSPQLALGMTPAVGTAPELNSDLQLDLGAHSVKVRGIFGFLELPYPRELELPLTRTGGRAAWDAWRPMVVMVIAGGGMVAQFAIWWLLAASYTLPAWMVAAVLGRSPGGAGMMKLCCAAVVPGMILPWLALLLYATRVLPLPGLGIGAGLCLLVGWLWLGWALLMLPKARVQAECARGEGQGSPTRHGGRKGNPFKAS